MWGRWRDPGHNSAEKGVPTCPPSPGETLSTLEWARTPFSLAEVLEPHAWPEEQELGVHACDANIREGREGRWDARWVQRGAGVGALAP